MIRAADALPNDDQKPAYSLTSSFCSHARAVLDELHLCQLEEDKEKFATLALFLDARIQQTKVSVTGLCPYL